MLNGDCFRPMETLCSPWHLSASEISWNFLNYSNCSQTCQDVLINIFYYFLLAGNKLVKKSTLTFIYVQNWHYTLVWLNCCIFRVMFFFNSSVIIYQIFDELLTNAWLGYTIVNRWIGPLVLCFSNQSTDWKNKMNNNQQTKLSYCWTYWTFLHIYLF